MSRCFRILGLSENATKSQVQVAYERKAARYKGPDYGEEPEYAHRKLAELKTAYEEAYRLARTDGTSRGYTMTSQPAERKSAGRIVRSGSEPKRRPSSRLRDAERKEADHERGEKFHQWLEKREESKARKKNKDERKKGSNVIKEKLKNPDFSRIKDALKEIAADLKDDDSADGTPISVDSGQHLGQEGTGKVKKADSKDSKGNTAMSIISTVLSLIIASMALFGSCESDDASYEEYETGYDSIYNYEEIADSDIVVRDLAQGSREMLFEQGEEASASFPEETEDDYLSQASEFAKIYFGMESVEDVTDDLYGRYYEYPIDSSATLNEQLDNIFIFYGFMQTWDAGFYRNPYTGEQIHGNADYLDYLNQYYSEIHAANY